MSRKSMFERYGKAYVCRHDEPSCFGKSLEELLDNVWDAWANRQPENNLGHGRYLRQQLIKHLRTEQYTLAEVHEIEEPPITTPSGDLSLAWVIFMRNVGITAGIHTTYEQVHVNGVENLRRQRQKA